MIAESDPGGLWYKSVYDGAGRDIMDYTTDGAGGASWSAAASVASDTVLEQTQTVYDADSNVIETIYSQRFHNATGTGPLGSPTSGIGARVYYAASYYDNADRVTADVDVGTNGGVAWTRPSSAPTPSTTVLVTSYAYNAAGWVQDVTDPMGIDTRTLYDNLGRVTETIQDYTGGTPGNENDVATLYGYDGNDNVTYVQADEPGGAYQQTAYVYNATTTGGDGLNSYDILTAIEHPDPTSGNPSATQKDSYVVDALGEVTQSTDRDGNVHQYAYDVLGRITSDAVTTLGAGVDGSIRRIQYAYDSQGNNNLITSYNAASGGSIVNQVQRVYNGLGQLTGEYQSHSGAVVSGTPEVQYAYNEMAGAANNSRLVSMTYPDGYTLNYNYNTGMDSNISRLSSISDSVGTVESYKYLGLDTVVERDHPNGNNNVTYIEQGNDPNANHDGGDQYTGLDRFGRVIDQNWVNATTGATLDRYQYGYDADSDVLYRQNLSDAALSELYTYDNLNQLTSMERGTLNATHNGLVGNPSHSQSWSPDALGNFNSVTTDGSTQTRTANQQNEITTISGQNAPTYDANGNLLSDGAGNTYVYDAWNRLVSVSQSGTVAATYVYDGLGRRIQETHSGLTTDLYLSSQDQVLEEYQGSTLTAYSVWSPVYVNALIFREIGNGYSYARYYVLQDANWNVTALTDTSANLLERYVYDAYGAITVLAADWSYRGASNWNIPNMWQGMRYDWKANLYHTWGRDISPTIERPLQPDPTGQGPDVNVYRWEGDGATNALDPSGMSMYAGIIDSMRRAGYLGGYHGGMGNYGRGTASYGGLNGGGMGVPGYNGGNGGYYVRGSPSYGGLIGGGMGVPGYGGVTPPVMGKTVKGVDIVTPILGTFQEAAEPALIVMDLIQAVGAGVYMGVTGKPFEPRWVSQVARNAPSPSDLAANNEYMKKIQVDNLIRGAWSVGGWAFCKMGGKNLGKVFGRMNCFPYDTLVDTETGLRPISTVEPGEQVWAYDFKCGEWRLHEVECRHDSMYEGPLVTLDFGFGEVTSTAYHPFWVIEGKDLEDRPPLRHVEISEDRGESLRGRWVNSHDIREGDTVFLRGRGPVTVLRVRSQDELTAVCNLTIQGLHTFAVGQIQVLVHNVSGTRAAALAKLKELGLGDVDLAGKSFNAGRKALENAGFELVETTSTWRQVFQNIRTGARVYFDSGKALAGNQKPHWHIQDNAGRSYDRSGRLVGSDENAAHIPAN